MFFFFGPIMGQPYEGEGGGEVVGEVVKKNGVFQG